ARALSTTQDTKSAHQASPLNALKRLRLPETPMAYSLRATENTFAAFPPESAALSTWPSHLIAQGFPALTTSAPILPYRPAPILRRIGSITSRKAALNASTYPLNGLFLLARTQEAPSTTPPVAKRLISPRMAALFHALMVSSPSALTTSGRRTASPGESIAGILSTPGSYPGSTPPVFR